VAASILKARGFEKLTNVAGGFVDMIETDLPMTEFVEQSTEL
jgi:hydroxyacylglutathione hydrolase